MTEGRGIRTLSRAGGFGRAMWARRWITDLESRVEPRREVFLARSAARDRRVLSLHHSGRTVRLEVAGSRPEPFEVEFRFAPLDSGDTGELRDRPRSAPGGVLGLLAGDIDDRTGFLLLPAVDGETEWTCPCPEGDPGPCRHVLAAACVMVEWWDRRPEVLPALRGIGARELGAAVAESADGVPVDVAADLWGDAAELPVIPEVPVAAPSDLLDSPLAWRLASAATRDPLEQMRVLADLEDFFRALGPDTG